MNIDDFKLKIRHVPDFPKAGILFYDITTLLQDPAGLHAAVRFKVIPGPASILLSESGTNVETLTTNMSGIHYKICLGHGVGVR